jgi:hypothetical protein
MNGAHQLLFYDDYVNLLGRIRTVGYSLVARQRPRNKKISDSRYRIRVPQSCLYGNKRIQQ